MDILERRILKGKLAKRETLIRLSTLPTASTITDASESITSLGKVSLRYINIPMNHLMQQDEDSLLG